MIQNIVVLSVQASGEVLGKLQHLFDDLEDGGKYLGVCHSKIIYFLPNAQNKYP